MPVTSKVHQDPDGSGKVTGYDVLMEDTTPLAGPQAVKDQNASFTSCVLTFKVFELGQFS